VSALHQTIKLLVQAGNFRQAADREKEVSHHTEADHERR
jgi:alpha-soluble NSF attachment protein